MILSEYGDLKIYPISIKKKQEYYPYPRNFFEKLNSTIIHSRVWSYQQKDIESSNADRNENS